MNLSLSLPFLAQKTPQTAAPATPTIVAQPFVPSRTVQRAAVPALPDPTAPFHILSLSGGGYMALYTARVLAGLEETLQAPLRTRFDLVAGTSAGGILAMAVAMGVPMKLFADAFAQAGPYIFSDTPPTRTRSAAMKDFFRFALHSRYTSDTLDAVLAQFLPDDFFVADLATRIVIPTTNLTQANPETLRTHHLPQQAHANAWRVRDVCLATTAAPMFFPLHEVAGHLYADGGIYANAPDSLALHEASGMMHIPDSNIAMLSIGTVSKPPSLTDVSKKTWGLRQWTREQFIIKTVMHSQERTSIRLVEQRLHNRYLRLDGRADDASAHLLGLDVATKEARALLESLAAVSLDTMHTDPRLKRFVAHQAATALMGPRDLT